MRRKNIMKCSRCSGLMAYEKFYRSVESFFWMEMHFCGEIIDEVILRNRAKG